MKYFKSFNYRKKMDRGIKKRNMYLIILSITMVHVLFTLIWILKNEINSILAYTKDLKEYTKCVFPESNIIRYI